MQNDVFSFRKRNRVVEYFEVYSVQKYRLF